MGSNDGPCGEFVRCSAPEPKAQEKAAQVLDAESVRNVLRRVIDPELGADIVELGMVGRIEVGPASEVTVQVALTVAGCPLRTRLREDVVRQVRTLPGAGEVRVEMGVMDPEQRSSVMAVARRKAAESAKTRVPARTRVIAVASGKGGVGKSTIAVALASALATGGATVGLLDADIWGYSVPRLLGGAEPLSPVGTPQEWSIVPSRQSRGKGTLEIVSMGLIAQQEQEAIMWRGLMLNRAFQHFLEDVAWGDLDYLVIDMPPGTGDIQMGLARLLPRAEMLIVTTPPRAAANVAARVADMAIKGGLRVMGVVENMHSFRCDHGTEYRLFGEGGADALAERLGAPVLARLPFEPPGEEAGPEHGRLSEAVATLAAVIVGQDEAAGQSCSARMLANVEAAVAAGDRGRS